MPPRTPPPLQRRKTYPISFANTGRTYNLTVEMVHQSERLSDLFLELKLDAFVFEQASEKTSQMLYNWLKHHEDDGDARNISGGSGIPHWDEVFLRCQDFNTLYELHGIARSWMIPRLDDYITILKDKILNSLDD